MLRTKHISYPVNFRILIVDDNQNNQNFLQEMLAETNIDYDTAVGKNFILDKRFRFMIFLNKNNILNK